VFGSSALSSVYVQAGNHFIHLFLTHLVKISSLWEIPPLFGSEIEFTKKLGWEFLIASYRSFPPVGPKSGTAKIHVILRDKQNRTISAYYKHV
jgi:hypothetical protein